MGKTKLKHIWGNHTEALSCNEADDNTVTEGFISSEQLNAELKQSAINTTSYIERLKEKMNSQDYKALQEQIKSNEFREQLRKQIEVSREKINQMYERARLSSELNTQKQKLLNTFKEAQEKLQMQELETAKQENVRLQNLLQEKQFKQTNNL